MRNDETPFGKRLERIYDTPARDSPVNVTQSSPLLRVLTSSEVPNYSHHRSAITTASSNTTASRGFYRSYNPDVGIQTAAVLGGILAFLVVYVIYRTKCRKRLLKAIDACAMRLFPDEYMPESGNDVITHDRSRVQDASAWNKENAKIVWTEEGSGMNKCESYKAKEKRFIQVKCSPQVCSCAHDFCDASKFCDLHGGVNTDECRDHHLKLPECISDTEQATAHWVQNVKLLDPKDKEISGIVLKIPPDLVHKSYRTRANFLSASDYIDSDSFLNISFRNKSLPLLLEGQRGLELYDKDVNTHSIEKETASSEDSLSSPTVPMPAGDRKPHQLHIQHQTGTKVPLDICPIIKIQQFHSRSKRRLTSLCRTSSDDSVSSDSSNDPLLIVTSHPAATQNALGAKKANSFHGSDVTCENHVSEMKTGVNKMQKVCKANSVVAVGIHETKL